MEEHEDVWPSHSRGAQGGRSDPKGGGGTASAGDGRKVLPPYLNDLEHDRRYPPENEVIEQLARILKLSPDVLYFYARRVPGDIERDVEEECIVTAYDAWRGVLCGEAR